MNNEQTLEALVYRLAVLLQVDAKEVRRLLDRADVLPLSRRQLAEAYIRHAAAGGKIAALDQPPQEDV